MIRIICPQDPTIRSVERQARRLDRRIGADSKVYVVKPNDISKKKCHRLIESWSIEDVIIFMGHGRSDALFGSRGKNFNMTGCEAAIDRESDDYYNDESFIDESNYNLFSGKSIICFSCESDLLGNRLLKAGARAVVGFGKMPSSWAEFEQDVHFKERINNRMIAYINGALNVAFRDAVLITHKMHGSLIEFAAYFKMEIRRQIYLLLHSKAKFRYCMANVLYDISGTVTVMGDKSVIV